MIKTVKWSTDFLQRHGSDTPRLDVELLLSSVLSCKRIDLYVDYDRPLSKPEKEAFRGMLQRRGRGEPIAYILGEKEFMGLSFRVNPHVLIPRPETEMLVEEVERLFELVKSENKTFRVLDVGTGSGCIPISLARRLGALECVGWDVCSNALSVAQENVRLHFSDSEVPRVHLIQRDALDVVAWEGPAQFDFIVSNPPYIGHEEAGMLGKSVIDYEPQKALFADEGGLGFYRFMARYAGNLLKAKGHLIFEIGKDQSADVVRLLSRDGWSDIMVRQDYAGHDRCIVAQKRE